MVVVMNKLTDDQRRLTKLIDDIDDWERRALWWERVAFRYFRLKLRARGLYFRLRRKA